MNLFRCTPDGSLDKQYLRICAVYRLLKKQRIGKARATQLMKARGVKCAPATVEMWMANPLKNIQIAA